ncbi:MAG: galactokinase, partial [Firmicutes bacterium]|nr:galactokinase [Bacillota bacterium]
MDQASIALGGINAIDFKDLNSVKVTPVDIDLSDNFVVIINCGGDHCNLTPNYSAIKNEMEAVANSFGKKKLREVCPKAFEARLPELKKQLSGRAILRAMHFYEENERVESLITASNAGNNKEVMNLINLSGLSSESKLQNLYPEGTAEQPIPLALAMIKNLSGVNASRVHGGGFAGTILALVSKKSADKFLTYCKGAFGNENVFCVDIRTAGACEIILKP